MACAARSIMSMKTICSLIKCKKCLQRRLTSLLFFTLFCLYFLREDFDAEDNVEWAKPVNWTPEGGYPKDVVKPFYPIVAGLYWFVAM